MRKILVLVTVALLGFMLSCSSNKPVGSETVVEENPSSKPDWVTQIPESEDGLHFFRGFKTNSLSLEDGLTDARQHAIGQVISMISADGMEDYNKARVEMGIPESREDVGTVIKDGLRILSRNVARGVKEIESYYEKVERVTHTGVRYFYNVYILVKYPEEEYRRALAETLNEQKKAARAQSNKAAEEFIDQMNQRFFQGADPAATPAAAPAVAPTTESGQ
jgi:hypothetical protein